MNGWNFHGHIAIPLEEYGKIYIGSSCRTTNEIEQGEFVDAMLAILCMKFGTLEDVKSFVDQCRWYDRKKASEIPREEAQAVYDEFIRLVNLRG